MFVFSDPVPLAGAAVLLPLSVLTAVVNSLVIITIWKDPFKKLKGTANCLTLNLAVCDLLVGILGELLFALSHWVPDDWSITIAAHTTSYLGFTASFLTILGLAVERLIAISSPLKSQDYLTSTYLSIGILSIWLFAGLIAFLPLLGWDSVEGNRLFICDAIALPILILLFACYTRIYFLVRNLSTGVERAERLCLLTVSAQNMEKLKRRERSVAYSVFILVGLFAVCWIPVIVLENINVGKKCISEHHDYFLASTIFLHPLANPIAYALRTVKFRRALKRIIFNCNSESPRRAIAENK